MKFAKYISTTITVVLLLLFYSTYGQTSCYETRKDHLGVTGALGLTELGTAACELVNALPEPFRPQFKIYSTSYYLHTTVTTPGFPPMLESFVTEVGALSPYYLIIAKESASDGVFKKFKVVLKLPETGQLSCMTANERTFIESQLAMHASSAFAEKGSMAIQYPYAEKAVVDKLKRYIQKSIDCCASGNKMACESCSMCPDGVLAGDIQTLFEQNLNALKIPIWVDKCTEPATPNGLAYVSALKERKFKFRQSDPYGTLASVINNVLSSDYFDNIAIDKRKGYATSNFSNCIPQDIEVFNSIKEVFLGTPAGLGAKMSSSLDYAIWCHVWEDPNDTEAQSYLYIASKTPDWTTLTAENNYDILASLNSSYKNNDYDNTQYQNKFEQSASVATFEAVTLREKGEPTPFALPDTLRDFTSDMAALGCDLSNSAEYFLNVAMHPIKLPAGIITDFDLALSNAAAENRDIRALLFFTDKHGRWRSFYTREVDGTKYHTGFKCPEYSLKPYTFDNETLPSYNVWLLNQSESKYPNRQVDQHKFTRHSGMAISPTGVGPYVGNFTNIDPAVLQAGANYSIELNTHTLKELQEAYAKAAVSIPLNGLLMKVPKIPGSPLYDFYLLNHDKVSGTNSWFVFNCNTGNWDKLSNDPFVLNGGEFKICGYVILESPWLEHFINTSQLTKHDLLDALGMIPLVGEAFDLANGVLYYMEGEKGLAILSSLSAIPLIGSAYAGTKQFLKLSSSTIPEIASKGVHSISIFKKCSNKSSSTGVCYIAAHLYPNDLRKKADNLANDNPNDFTEFITEVVDETKVANNYGLSEVVSKAIHDTGSGTGPDIFQAWLLLKYSKAARTSAADVTVWANRLEEIKKARIDLINVPTSGGNYIVLRRKGITSPVEDVGRVVDGKLLTTKYVSDNDFYNSTWAKVGDRVNGNQIYKRPGGGGVVTIVRREPDLGYPQEILDIVRPVDPNTGKMLHPTQHCLERHADDVSDEALRLRATESIAADGKKAPGAYSSKFGTKQDLAQAIDLVGPNSQRFSNKLASLAPGETEMIIKFTDPSGKKFGYGYEEALGMPTHTLVRTDMTSVTVSYNKDSSGKWILNTMYPDVP
jgi:hypothetical protein